MPGLPVARHPDLVNQAQDHFAALIDAADVFGVDVAPLLLALPLAYVLLGLGVIAAIAAVTMNPRAIEEELVALLLLGSALLAMGMMGALSAASRAVIEQTSTLRYLAMLILRPSIPSTSSFVTPQMLLTEPPL